ncbi:MAG: hypothetical protein AAGE03_15015 [Pseudomonadota bacterium]
MASTRDPDDPKGLIRDAYRIEGISAPECRSIFLDWVLGIDDAPDAAIIRLLAAHGVEGHPMTAVLQAGLGQAPAPQRRGGRAARVRD